MSNNTEGVKPMQDANSQGPKPAKAPACVMVIFGAAGDLAKRLLIPALYNLAKGGLLDDGFKVLGIDHNERDDAKFRQNITGFLEELTANSGGEFEVRKLDPDVMKWLSDRLFYQVADFTDAASFQALGGRL